MAGADPDPVRICEEASRFHHLVIIGKGLSHPHEDNVAHPLTSEALNRKDLLDDLPRCEVAHQSAKAGGAKWTTDTATSLGRNARRPP